MTMEDPGTGSGRRDMPLEITGAEFRALGHRLVDQIAGFLDGLPRRPVTAGESPREVRGLLGDDALPETGSSPALLLEETTRLLFDHSLFNGHPRFWGYITSSAAPIGALADLLAASVNPNVGAAVLSPMATEIEAQTIRWIADLIGYPRDCGGLLVSGGNMANFVCVLAARQARVTWDLKEEGLAGGRPRLLAYATKETHSWIDKAMELFGLGRQSVRWVATDADQRMETRALEAQIAEDLAGGHLPFLVIGAAGTVSTGAIDPLPAIAAVCRTHGLWFHVDGAYGAPAAVLDDAPADLLGLREADSVALDPHKWLYNPLEAGCALVRDSQKLLDTFSHHPVYYNFNGTPDDPSVNYHELGLQNSRGFRALKVWLALRQVGRSGYRRMIGDDIALARALHGAVASHPELQAVTQNLSITTFRYIPTGLTGDAALVEPYLNMLNEALVNRLQREGVAFISNAVIDGRYLLRPCIVNFRTTLADITALPGLVADLGRDLDSQRRPAGLGG